MAKKLKVKPLARVNDADLAGLRLRKHAWDRAQAMADEYAVIAGSCQEAYVHFGAEVAERYSLPEVFDVDLGTGDVRAAEG